MMTMTKRAGFLSRLFFALTAMTLMACGDHQTATDQGGPAVGVPSSQDEESPVALNDFRYEAQDERFGDILSTDFDPEWKAILVFRAENVAAEQREFLQSMEFKVGLEKRIEPSTKTVRIIGGVFKHADGTAGSFLALIDGDGHVLKVQKLDQSPRLVFFRENDDSVYAGTRFYSEFFYEVVWVNGEYLVRSIEAE